MSQEPPIRYTDDLEEAVQDEEKITRETIDLMRSTMAQTFEQHRHATSGTHAKSHGIATGTLTVPEGLPPELAQGLLARPATYDVVLRFASEPGQIDPDSARRARGAALKVLDVPGPKLAADWPSHDILLNTWPVIPEGDPASYLTAIRQRERHAGHHLRTTATSLARARDPQGVLFERTPTIPPLAHRYYTQAAFRYGDHVAKLRISPATAAMQAQADRHAGRTDPPGVLSTWTREFLAEQPAQFTLEAQLCTDLEAMPVEDASVEWPEDRSPYRTVAVLDLPAQETFSPARRTWAEDVLGFRPWNGLEAHRPLGSLNRLRRRVYEELGAWRREMNAVEAREPRSLADVPD